jgi:hypothetical protein
VIDGTIREATAGGQGTAVQYAHWARSMLLNGLGRYEEALASAQQAPTTPPSCSWPSGAERADRGRDPERETALAPRRPRASRGGGRRRRTDWGLGSRRVRVRC